MLKPPEQPCRQCGHALHQDDLECATAAAARQPVVYGLTWCKDVEVQRYRCKGCGTLCEYDGLADGVLNLNNMDLFTHELLRW